ncbi:DUF1707 SHOCT-like domain-containing protein [Nocardia sp. NPDC003693]
MGELPDIRIGTAEREDALRRLSDHFAAGRLSVAEFDERSGQVAAAVTRGDLVPMFADLPEPVETAKAVPAQREPRFGTYWPERIGPALPILALILFLVTHQWWVLLLIPLAGVLFGQSKRERKRRNRERRNRG